MLISCPICGEKVSDTTDTCVHCGSYLKSRISDKNSDEKIKFHSLPAAEQLKLETEYLTENYSARAQKNLFLNQKKNSFIILAVTIVVTLAIILVMILLSMKTEIFTKTVVSQEIINGRVYTVTRKQTSALFSVLLTVGGIAPALIGGFMNAKLIKQCKNAKEAYAQGFQVWLDTRGYSYEVSRLFE